MTKIDNGRPNRTF